MHPLAQQVGDVSVSQAVESNRPDLCPLHEPRELPRKVVGDDGLAGDLGEDEPAIVLA
jgi:hypothetical protein